MMQRQRINDIVRPVLPKQRRNISQLCRVVGITAGSIVVLGVVAWLFFCAPWGQQRIMNDRYQAVYLTSGQIYFGKLQNTSGDFLTLKTPYTAQQKANGDSTTQTETSLIKVTQQVYGPDDSIALRIDQVQFWQNLRPDSKIVQTIESSK